MSEPSLTPRADWPRRRRHRPIPRGHPEGLSDGAWHSFRPPDVV